MNQTGQEAVIVNAQSVPDVAKAKLAVFWKNHSKQIAAVTAGNDVERVMRVTYSVLYRNPKLIECTPFSLLNGIVLAHQMGLVFGTPEVSLVPFGKEATLIIGYQGKAKLALASKVVTSIETELVYDCDEFDFRRTERGLTMTHVPNWRKRADAGPASEQNVLGAYCQVGTSGGGVQTRFVSLGEIIEARNRSRGYQYQVAKGGTDNPWFTAFGAMALKTAAHRGLKLAPQDASLGLASAVDDQDEGGAAVIAEGLDITKFADKDLHEPLVETSTEAQEAAADRRLAELGAPRPQGETVNLAFGEGEYRVDKAAWEAFRVRKAKLVDAQKMTWEDVAEEFLENAGMIPKK